MTIDSLTCFRHGIGEQFFIIVLNTSSETLEKLRDTLLHINRKFTMEILQSSLLPHSFALNRRSTSISRCKIRHEADLAVSVASFKSSSTG